MSDIAIIGAPDEVLLAGAAGIKAYGISDKSVACKKIISLAKEGTKVILVTEKLYADCKEVITRYKTLPFPAIIPVPDSSGPTGAAMAEIKANVEKAIGVDILFGEDNKKNKSENEKKESGK